MPIYESYVANTSSGYKPDAPIVLREEQKDAVKLAKSRFKNHEDRKFLWNAKMRFGKTLSALQLVKELDAKRTLIITHRPVVDANFREDFDKIFQNSSDWIYASRSDNGGTGEIASLEKELIDNPNKHYVFFASMQYLCRSNLVNSKENADDNPLKHLILNNNWDLVVVDEAHEATTGDTLGGAVVKYLSGKKANMLHLSGTPFNLYHSFGDNEIFTWDYIQEQAKKNSLKAQGVPDSENPYITLPKMNIFTYDLSKLRGSDKINQDTQFTLSEFFRTWSGNKKKDKAEMPEGAKGKFVHEEAVNNFLSLLCGGEDGNNYPFSTEEYQENFNHTLWVVPGVKEAKALKELLEKHEIFGNGAFEIINVAGEGDGSDEERSNALDRVLNAIGDAPDQTATITISCGRLTTGVTVAPWTAVFYLKGSDNTSAATYMQTIFRVQSAHVYNGKMKSECYVFDFAPDRSLRAVAETAKFYNLNSKQRAVAAQASEDSDIAKLKEFMDFCPVISLDGGKMEAFDANRLFKELHKVYIDRIISSGYTDNALFNKDAIMQMDPDALKVLDSLDSKDRIHSKGEGKCNPNQNISTNGLNGSGGAPDNDPGDGSQSSSNQLSDAVKADRKAKREELEKRRAKLRDITIRIPLLIFGGEFHDDADIKLDNFTRKVRDESWREFMPKNISKEDFNKLKKGINADMFLEAGKQIRKMTREADSMHVEERIAMIAKIHDWFNNPNKETVLTPWKVVNMHLSDCLGGYCFMNESFTGPNEVEVPGKDGTIFEFAETIQPRFVSRGDVTRDVFGCDCERPIKKAGGEIAGAVISNDGTLRPSDIMDIKILEINSKTGLYPLYATYSLYRNRLQDYIEAGLVPENREDLSVEEEQVVWDDVLQNNLYVISNTDMAEGITRRTLYGFRDVKGTHIKHEPIVEQAKSDINALAEKLRSQGFWNGTTSKNMLKFTAVIGNPPYMELNEGKGNGSDPLYHIFIDLGKQIAKKGSLIHPGRFLFNAGKTPKEWNEKILNDYHFKVVNYISNSSEIFPSVEIKGGIAITLWDNDIEFGKIGAFSKHNEIHDIINKVKGNKEDEYFLSSIVSPRELYKITVSLYEENPLMEERQSKGHKFSLGSNIFEIFPEIFYDKQPEEKGYSLVYGRANNQRCYRYVKSEYITHPKSFYAYKVIIAKANGSGKFGETLAPPIIGKPNEGYTDTFISIGCFDTLNEAESCLKYIKTKFTRSLLSSLKVTQINPKEVWSNIPIQDFTSSSEVPWYKSIEEIDKYLFEKYGLTNEEREFIRKMVKPMD